MYDIKFVIDQIKATALTDDESGSNDEIYFVVAGEKSTQEKFAITVPSKESDSDHYDIPELPERSPPLPLAIELIQLRIDEGESVALTIGINEDDTLADFIPSLIGVLISTAGIVASVIGAQFENVILLSPALVSSADGLYSSLKRHGQPISAFSVAVNEEEGKPKITWVL